MIKLEYADAFGETGGPEYLVNDYLNLMLHADEVTFSKGGGTASISGSDAYGYHLSVDFRGKGDGTIHSMNFDRVSDASDDTEVSYADGFDMRNGAIRSAINAAAHGDTSEVKALFNGLDWHFTEPKDFSYFSTPVVMVFGGTGGDDRVKLGLGDDELQLDGGNDKVKLGAGDDTIDLDNLLVYRAPGLSQINGNAGFDCLDLSTEQANYELTHGLVINLNKKIDIGAFSIQLKNVEEVIGTIYSDNITGTNGDDVLYGGGGGDTLTGGGGADELIGAESFTDRFIYHQASNSPAGAGRDTIDGFKHSIDLIDLSLIDPGTKDHKFHFVGDAPLEHEGDLRFVHHQGNGQDYTLIQANLDDDKGAEFEIKLTGDVDLSKDDFLL